METIIQGMIGIFLLCIPIILAFLSIKLLKNKFYIITTNIAFFIHYYISAFLYGSKLNVFAWVISTLLLIISAKLSEDNKIFKVIYFVTIIYIFFLAIMNILSGNIGLVDRMERSWNLIVKVWKIRKGGRWKNDLQN